MISLVVGLILVGFLLWLLETRIPMNDAIKRLIEVVVILGCVIYVARYFGVF